MEYKNIPKRKLVLEFEGILTKYEFHSAMFIVEAHFDEVFYYHKRATNTRNLYAV